jgi:ketosteroid isomerase-like protein
VTFHVQAARYFAHMSANVELVRAWQRAASAGEIDELLALSHADFEMTEASVLPGAVHVKGREALRSYCYGWARNWSEWDWREDEVLELPGDRVVLDSTLRLRGLRSSLWVEHRWAYLFEIRDGLILRNDGFQTKAELLASLG